ncbi:glycoside hydrolase family 5 protein [Treponema zuelzerae]|uniref:Glycoside hydrolase family 5 protein n=2 Tax=Teretinema zuelzerae TaxID=156 RepID=A0AAE3JKA5_9SPIR|nr:glycoside hydrolase family 5 protein [Teretinema zuelzerae]
MNMHVPDNKKFLAAAFAAFVLFVLVIASSCSSNQPALGDSIPPEPSYPETPGDPLPGDFSLSAREFVSGLGTGWNLGNTLDAYGTTGLASETSWGQPRTTQDMMKNLKASGIDLVRIPVSWHNHADEAFTIDPEWMARVKTVVDYALAEDLRVIINIHHDNEKEYYFPDAEHAERSLAFVTRVWKQIALTFRNYDENLIFELLNEPRLVGYANEWGWSDSDSALTKAASIIGELEQSALDVVRASGSNNKNRYVMITPYVASPWAALSSRFVVPEDSAEDKLILSVHAYTPYSFAMEDPGEKIFTDKHRSDIDTFMANLNDSFTAKRGIPVIIGEYGATNKNNLAARVEWFSYYVGKAASYGMPVVLWDNGNHQVPSSGSFSELYGFYNRVGGSWYSPEILEAILGAL